MERVDVGIVGLGPAGAMLARLLPENLTAAAIDRKTGPDGWRKPCGGLLAPDAQKALAELGLTLPRELLVDPQIFSVHTLDLRTGLDRHYQRFYLNLDRALFDGWLRSLVPDRVRVHDGGYVTGIERTGDLWRVTFLEDGAERALECRFLVGADGANSAVRRAVYPDAPIRQYVAIQQWFADENPRPFYSCVFDPAATDCYSWALSKNGRFLFGGAYPADGCRARFEEQKRRLAALGFRFGTPLETEACLVSRPARASQIRTGRDGVFLLGEAAGFISPSSLEGVSWALRSAMLLRDALAAGDPRRHYDRACRALRLRLAVKLLKCPFMYHPALRRLVMKSGLQRIDVEP